MSTALDVATVATQSTCDRLELILKRDAASQPLLGAMLAIEVDFDDGDTEVALGAVTAIETVNPLMDARGAMASHLAVDSATPIRASQDNRRVIVKVEAVFRGHGAQWRRWSTTLSNSPATGTSVQVLDQELADVLMSDAHDVGYLGTLRGPGSVLVPMTLPHYATDRGAVHIGLFGQSGSGKSAFASYFVSTMMRHEKMAFLVADPQGQWSREHGLPISLQGVASALGRQVIVARISQSLRLQKDAPLFLRLLQEAGFFRLLAFGASAEENMAAARATFADALSRTSEVEAACHTGDWTEASSADLLTYLLDVLHTILPTGTVYAGREQQERVAATIYRPEFDSRGEPLEQRLADRLPAGALDKDGQHKFDQLLEVFAALHQLWGPFNPAGLAEIADGTAPEDLDKSYRRTPVWGVLTTALRPPENSPAPLVILDLSADVAAGTKAAEILDSKSVKARIMRQIVGTIKRVGQSEFSAGRTLNALWLTDEAWEWAGPVDSRTQSDAQIELSNEFASAARDVRKFGIGMGFITQSITSIRDDIWRQLGVVFVGYGLHDQADVKKLAGKISDAHVALYRATPPPAATGRYVWTCIGGQITGLSLGTNPVFLEVFTDPALWLQHNEQWITELRARYLHCLPDGDRGGRLTAIPGRPVSGDRSVRTHTSLLDVREAPTSASVMAAFSRPRTPGHVPAVGPGKSGRWAAAADAGEPPF